MLALMWILGLVLPDIHADPVVPGTQTQMCAPTGQHGGDLLSSMFDTRSSRNL